MSQALLSLLALIVVIIFSRQEKVNVGWLAIVFALGLGFTSGLKASELVSLFPEKLFLILGGITYFFSLVKENGTLDVVLHRAMRHNRVRAVYLPAFFFMSALLLALVGPGNIGSVALLAPLALSLAGKIRISAFVMTFMLVNGANAGAFSPFAPTGIIANQLIERIGINMDPWRQVFLPSFFVQSAMALICYVTFLVRFRPVAKGGIVSLPLLTENAPVNWKMQITMVSLVFLVVAVSVFRWEVGWVALGLSALLVLLKAANFKKALYLTPWSIIVMVCGVSMLVNVMGKTGGLGLFTDFLARIANPQNVSGVLALVTGIISSYSSSSGIVMPTFIMLVPELIEKIGGGSAVAMVAAINVGSHVVDISPLSTLGALCIANADPSEPKEKLFRRLLLFGLLMALLGAVACQLLLGVVT